MIIRHLAVALCSMTLKVSANNQGFRMFIIGPIIVSAELRMTEQNESQLMSTVCRGSQICFEL